MSVPFTFVSADEGETERLGRAVAAALEPGAVLALIGELGAGKTRLVRAVAEAAGVDRQHIASPTFVLVHEYPGRLPLYHFDAYRLESVEEFLDLGAEELLAGEGACLIEWADRVLEALPPDRLDVRIEATGETERTFRFEAGGERSARLLDAIREGLT